MKKPNIALILLILIGWFVVETGTADAGWRRRSWRSRGARPVTGYGSNIHRNFVLKQEQRRASQGRSVRYRGNIRWR